MIQWYNVGVVIKTYIFFLQISTQIIYIDSCVLRSVHYDSILYASILNNFQLFLFYLFIYICVFFFVHFKIVIGFHVRTKKTRVQVTSVWLCPFQLFPSNSKCSNVQQKITQFSCGYTSILQGKNIYMMKTREKQNTCDEWKK